MKPDNVQPASPARALLEQAYLARRQGDADSALVVCRQALRLEPDNVSALGLLAQLQESRGDREAAITAYERIIELEPGNLADRIRLEELKNGEPPPIVTSPAPVMQNSARSAPGVFWPALSAILILVVGGILIFLHFQDRPAAPSSPAPLNGKSLQTSISQTNSAGAPQSSSDNKTAAAQPAASSPYPSYSPYGLPPTIIYEGSSQPQYSPPPNLQASPVNPIPNRAPHPVSAGRIVLPASDTTPAQDDNGVITIKVGPKSSRTLSSQQANSQGHIKLSISKGAPSDNSQDSAQTQTNIALGDQAQIQQHYDIAIAAYSRALESAGDEKGEIYQQMALCYQREGDKQSAATAYRSAIDAYNSLEKSGRRVSDAKAGILVCKQGLKTCGY